MWLTLRPMTLGQSCVVHDNKTTNFRAMPYPEIPAFIKRLRIRQRKKGVVSPLAVELLILTAARASEIAGMRWEEINWEQRTWTVVGYRTKTGRNHRVPLSDRALELLKQQCRQPGPGFVWTTYNEAMTPKSMYLFVRRYMREDCTVHGFRSSFRNWAAEQTDFDFNLCELCLAHSIRQHSSRLSSQ